MNCDMYDLTCKINDESANMIPADLTQYSIIKIV